MFKRQRIESQRIEALEIRQAALLSELHKLTKENEQLKAMLSEERCVGDHCRACDNYYRDIHGGVCVKNIKCKNFDRRFWEVGYPGAQRALGMKPEEPIKVANMLISATGTYTNLFGKEGTYNVYDKSDLRQIAEHLLVHCNNADADEN